MASPRLLFLLLASLPALTAPTPLTLRRAAAKPAAAAPEPLLLAPAIWALPLGAVLPHGWLEQQLRIQRDGLAGHLQLFYTDIANSTWLGGDATENGGLHERLPYWLNGAVPMAYLLPEEGPIAAGAAAPSSPTLGCAPSDGDAVFTVRRALSAAAPVEDALTLPRADAVLSGQAPDTCVARARVRDPAYSLRREVTKMVNYILDHQSDAGWFGGPANDAPGERDQYWPAWDILYSLLMYAEAEPVSAPRVQAALLRYVAEAERRLAAAPLDGWSSVRWPEWVAILQRMADTFDVAPDGPERAMLLRVAATVAAQGYDWRAYFTDASAVPNFNTSVPFAPGWTLTEHGVNHAMALKEGAVAWRAGGGALAAELSRLKVALLDKLHGMPTGAFSADECLGGREPNRGVELCTIVETAYSLALMHRTHGDIALADRAERVIYNGLPGALSDDMWSHNYLSQSNEIFAGHVEPHTWRTDGPDSTAYGLAPTYGCCTANFIQGWPKWVAGLLGYRLSPDGTRAAIVVSFYGPAQAAFPAAVGGGATLKMDTEYPFEDAVRLLVQAPRGVDVDLRIPGWAGAASVSLDGGPPVAAARGTFHTMRCASGGCAIVLLFAPAIEVTPGWGTGDGVAVTRGPLLFALPLAERWTALRSYEFQAKDYEVSSNSTWNMALLLRRGGAAGTLQHALELRRSGGGASAATATATPPPPFASGQPRVWLEGYARRCDAWTSPDGGHTADPPPPSPACGAQDACGPLTPVRLVPFGNTRLRISVMPYTLS